MIHIYALVDPRDGCVGYVGRTNRPAIRFRTHCIEADGHRTDLPAEWTTACKFSRRHFWLSKLRLAGVEPQFVTLEQTTRQESDAVELRWIKHYRAAGEAFGNAHDLPKRGQEWRLAPRPVSRRIVRDSTLQIRLSPEDKAKIKADAEEAGMSVSTWIRFLLTNELRRLEAEGA